LDVSAEIAAKTRAMDVYASQEAERPYCKRVIAQNVTRTWSLPAPVRYAEAFLVLDATDVSLADAVSPMFSRYLRGLAMAEPKIRDRTGVFRDGCDCEATVRALSDELRLVKQSRSWRWTAPYRHFTQMVRGWLPR